MEGLSVARKEKKLFPVAEDIAWYVNRLSKVRIRQQKRREALEQSIAQSTNPFSEKEKAVLKTELGYGQVMPLSEDALAEAVAREKKAKNHLTVLAEGKKDIAAGRVPRWEFVELLEELVNEDVRQHKTEAADDDEARRLERMQERCRSFREVRKNYLREEIGGTSPVYGEEIAA